MFDDMYIHYVKNPTKFRRAVLFIDVYRNNLVFPLNHINSMMSKMISNNKFLKNYDKTIHTQYSLDEKTD